MSSSSLVKAFGALVIGTVLAHGAHGLTVTAHAVDIQDTTVGQDLWRIDYALSGAVEAFHGVTLFFPVTSFSGLDLAVPPPAAEWSAALTPGDASAGFDGLLSLTAQQALSASAKSSLSLNFVATGPVPKLQSLEFFDDNFGTVPGAPIALVPEPSTWLLFAAGALAICWRRLRGRPASMTPRAALAAA